ncbi:hypothetical protein CRUP_009144 [Coryphaenoides rupestris]|nr:hypothetical protein CRUP_009144 [Coryphaenoides rupestris]
MYPPARHAIPHQPGQPFKFTITESCDRIKDEFQFLQAQYHSHLHFCFCFFFFFFFFFFCTYYEMSYGLNIEMHKQAEIVKRLNAICAQVIPFLSQEVGEPNTATAAAAYWPAHQQLQARTCPTATPCPSRSRPTQRASSRPAPWRGSRRLLALTSALGHHLPLKEERKHLRGQCGPPERTVQNTKRDGSISVVD